MVRYELDEAVADVLLNATDDLTAWSIAALLPSRGWITDGHAVNSVLYTDRHGWFFGDGYDGWSVGRKRRAVVLHFLAKGLLPSGYARTLMAVHEITMDQVRAKQTEFEAIARRATAEQGLKELKSSLHAPTRCLMPSCTHIGPPGSCPTHDQST